jgi:uncharacterized protein with ParB-like and HNH nuclease domain
MQTQKYSVNQHHISTFLAFVRDGQITIPEVQKPIVWDSSKVRDLLDSLYKGYQIGYVIAWQNPNELFLADLPDHRDACIYELGASIKIQYEKTGQYL